MNNYFQPYCDLISSSEQLHYCKQATTLSDLLSRIKKLWRCEQISDDELLGEIALLNQIPISTCVQTSAINLSGIWLPYRYQPKRQLINWLIPIGYATEPFQDEYISRCRQYLLNQIIQPCTSLEFVQQQAEKFTKNIIPAGFIFHLSRCGSTLISGCLSELDSTCVFSEPPLLTELLLDTNLSPDQQKTFLRVFITLQSVAFPQHPHVIIKWNAWDIFNWSTISELYPEVAVVFLVRDPVEILASHSRSAGRHMAGDTSLNHLNPIFELATTEQNLLACRSRVLDGLLREMNRFKNHPTILRVDYKNVDVTVMQRICDHFGLLPHPEKFLQRLKFHSKTPQVAFFEDAHIKQAAFSQADKASIQQALMPLYQQFFES